MKDRIKNTINAIKNDNKIVFYAACTAFAVIFSFARMFGDDIKAMRVEGGNIAAYWSMAIDMFYTWASRLFVNFSVFVFTDNRNIWLWSVFMGISLYVLMYSFSKLFSSEENEKNCNVVIACLVMLFPFHYLNSAGWIATMTIYLSPTAFGFFSLLPLKRVFDNKSISLYEYIIYSLSLVYGANNEQMMIVILGSYTVGFIILMLRKKYNAYILVQLLLSIASLLLIVLCPGNYARKDSEEISWFKNWGMFNGIDKIDLGYSTTVQNILFGSHAFLIVVCCLFTYLVWKKYKSTEYTLIAGIPTVFIVLLGPLRSIILTMFPSIKPLWERIDKNGLVTVVNRGDLKAFGRYAVWTTMIVLLSTTVLLLQDSLKMLVVNYTLLGTGIASRLVLGFSPTIHVSGERTFTVLYFCLIAVACYVYSNSTEKGYINGKVTKRIELVAKGLIICSMINILFLVAQS